MFAALNAMMIDMLAAVRPMPAQTWRQTPRRRMRLATPRGHCPGASRLTG
jgi:hypothetical protein